MLASLESSEMFSELLI